MAPRKSAAAAASVASPRRSARLKQAQSNVNSASGDESLEATIPHTPLDIPELLENILMNLPLRDILFSQRVCRMWQESIKQSPNIQEVLFLRTTSESRLTLHYAQGVRKTYGVGHWCKHGDGLSAERARWTEECDQAYQPIANPLVCTNLLQGVWDKGTEFDYRTKRMRMGTITGFDPQSTLWSTVRRGEYTMLGRMLLTYPPMRHLTAYIPDDVDYDSEEDDDPIHNLPHDDLRMCNSNGITVQDIGDRFKAHEDDCIACWDLRNTHTTFTDGKRWNFRGGSLVRRPKDGITGWEMLAMLRAASRSRRIITAAEDQESD
ncbi:hypothetical protein LTR27_003745 [Elasticomyces elasticus]|nr:hypothetical protein LTR27_003745 [Elasticomyces elasticus]